jgi:hypothetical protein
MRQSFLIGKSFLSLSATKKLSFFSFFFHLVLAIAFILISPTLNQQLLTNVPFECGDRRDGHWRDLRYCDVFHACVDGEQKRSYGCPQVGERFYFDDITQR